MGSAACFRVALTNEWSGGLAVVPQRLLTYAEFLEEVSRAYYRRNKAEFVWADGAVEPLVPDEFGRIDT